MIDYFLKETEVLVPAPSVAAFIVLEDGRYLMQERDQKAGIFYPGHWGLFGGAMNPGEEPEVALRRELDEELGLKSFRARHVTDFSFGFGRFGQMPRHYYDVQLAAAAIRTLTLGEGRAMRPFAASELLTMPRVVPYDSFAIFLRESGY